MHNNDDLPNVQKFTYLHSVLTGNAVQTIEGFEVTGANYQPAVECLKHRYGRKRVIVSSLVKSVIKMDAKSSVSASSLRDLYDTLKNRTRALEALGENPVSHGCILLPMFETKLPLKLLEKWELELADTPEDAIDLDLFFKFLNRQVVSKRQERGAFTQTLTQIIVVPVRVEMKARSQRTPIQVTVNEYQLLLLCSVKHSHH